MTGHLSWTPIGHVQHKDWMDTPSPKRGVLSSDLSSADQPVECPFCDSTIPAERISPNRYWCGCCARTFEVPNA